MTVFSSYLKEIKSTDERRIMEDLLKWVATTFPSLQATLKWNTPIFTDHDTFIIGFAHASRHISISPEQLTLQKFANEITQAGCTKTKNLMQIPWGTAIPYELVQAIIAFNIKDKAQCTSFWRSHT
ncbi:hypothetical protein A374_00335 [Fictibacillus macauensis ZFHKF-1]|uniref:YdhG-like domain-containing protein n=1 Tax=Fictibacillus macauensis ZFHKF-1 TaxID=1196324 RepID=I8UKH0_9BACL|nr:DUF1801 domain-containing protein [Fictibacillus macauensis]EIT87375.1 hypothetical protein A374_00335 [Fictibacillus macauensis ZFHKF-1]